MPNIEAPSFIATYTAYLLAQQARRLSVNYRSLLALTRDYWVKLHGDKPISACTPEDIRAWLIWLASSEAPGGKGMASSSVDIHYRNLKAFWFWTEGEGIIPFGSSPIRKVSRPKHSERLPDVLSPEEIKKLLKSVLNNPEDHNRYRNYVILLCFVDTGLRLEELSRLTLADVYLEQGFAKVVGKGDKERIVRLGLELRRSISKYRLQYRKSANGEIALFTGDTGFRLEKAGIRSMVVRALRAFVDRPLSRYGPHLLRHTYATTDLLVNNDLRGTSLSMGHANLQTTQRYVHLADMLRDTQTPMDAILSRKPR